MTYKTFIIDVFNTAYRLKSKILTADAIANNVINFINDEVTPRLEQDGKVYLAFDPIPKSDLGMEKNFKYSTTRQFIKREYKSNREHNPVVLAGISLLKKYYTYRGDNIKICISNEFEADDFVEGILQIEPTGTVAMVTNDLDWARYIDDRVHMINKGFNEPFTKDGFFKEKGYLPTVAAVTLTKAIFGDESDGISPILTKKNKIYVDNNDFIKALIKNISLTGTSFDEIQKSIDNAKAVDVISKTTKTDIEDIIALISASDDAWDAFLQNIRVIKSRCDDVGKYIYSHKINESYNNLMESTLGRSSVDKKKFVFGNIKLGKKK